MAATLVAALAFSPGCGLTLRSDIHDPDPASKIPALVDAADDPTAEELAAMIHALEHDDAAVRLFAIESLKRVTGEARGFLPYDPPERRAAAVARWRRWLNERPVGPASFTAGEPQEQRHGDR